MGAVGSVDTQCGHLAPCVPGADELIAKLGKQVPNSSINLFWQVLLTWWG